MSANKCDDELYKIENKKLENILQNHLTDLYLKLNNTIHFKHALI